MHMAADENLEAVTEILVQDDGTLAFQGPPPDADTVAIILEMVRLIDAGQRCPCPNCTARRFALGVDVPTGPAH